MSDSVAVPGKQSRNERIEEFLREHYAFRYNTVKSRAEFRSSDGEFLPVTKYRLNSFRRELDRTIGISTSAENLRSMLESDFSERVNPVQAYFHKLPPATGTQAIDELAATVTVRNALHWSEYLTKWLVGVVANAMNDVGCQNHVCLVLTGEQGKFKTTWLDNLCPRSLASYLFTGKIDPQNKDFGQIPAALRRLHRRVSPLSELHGLGERERLSDRPDRLAALPALRGVIHRHRPGDMGRHGSGIRRSPNTPA